MPFPPSAGKRKAPETDSGYNRPDMNLLYYGDNLDVLRRHVDDESVDLVYLDPPFNSNASYNVLFAEHDGARAASQIKAFEDTWRWDQGAARACVEMIEAGGKVSEAMQAFRVLLGDSDMMAYVAMMAPRLVELRRVLKPTGSIYLHCDPTASHYLKLVLDAVFGPRNFRNEIIWRRHNARSVKQAIWPRLHDVLLYYVKTQAAPFTTQAVASAAPADPHDLVRAADGRRYRTFDLTGAGIRHGETGQAWRGFDPTPKGRHWRIMHAGLDAIDREGRIYWPKSDGLPRERAADEYGPRERTTVVGDVWADIDSINAGAAERLGFPTQKPEGLLARIINASSDEGGTVLDPFCGCGTTIAAAQKLERRWIGIDVTHLAITLIRSRLADSFGARATYQVVGEPVSVPDAASLAATDPYQFQWWALGLVGARPVEGKKGADKGIDGRIYFHEGDTAKTKQIILSVKAGHVTVAHLRDLLGVLDREKAQIGVLLCMDEPTVPMRKECASAGFYTSPWGRHARLQILTVEDLLTGKTVDRPPAPSVTFRRAPKAHPEVKETSRIPFGEPEGSN